MKTFRKLIYHPESDCYVLLEGEKGEKEYNDMIDHCYRGEPLDDVTDIDHHEIEFLMRKRRGLKG